MYTYHLKNILECNAYNNEIVLNKLKAWGCKYEKTTGLVTDWHERLIPQHAPSDYLDLMSRLDDGFEYEYAGDIFKPTSRVQRSGRIYTTMTSATKKLNFQSSKSAERCKFTWNGLSLENFDVSASQLRVALALRRCTLPLSLSPWDTLQVEHPINEFLPSDIARELKKTVALLMIRGEKSISFKRIWLEKIEAPLDAMPSFRGYKNAVAVALLTDFPCLNTSSLGLSSTPDGYAITHRSNIFKRHDIHSRLLGIKTTFRRYESEPPTEANTLEAMEAFALRQVIRSLPRTSPVLTCHDQVYVLASDIPTVVASFESTLSELSMIS
jgi:hypothetical protein